MEINNDVSRVGSEIFGVSVEVLRSFIEEFGIHVLLEVSLVGIIDRFLMNTVLSMLMGISLVEGAQFLWRKWRKDE